MRRVERLSDQITVLRKQIWKLKQETQDLQRRVNEIDKFITSLIEARTVRPGAIELVGQKTL